MVKLYQTILILILSTLPVFAQNEVSENIKKSVQEFDLANIAMMKKDQNLAYTHLKNAVNFDPTNSTFLNSAAFMAMQHNEYDIALDYLNKALPLDIERYGDQHPAVASIYNNMGTVWSKKGDHKKAYDYLDKAYQIALSELGEKHPQSITIKQHRDAEKLN